MDRYIYSFPLAPSFAIQGDTPYIAENYTLNCNVSPEVSNPTFQWKKDNIMLKEIGQTLFFSPLRLSDAGLYTCTILSSYSTNKTITLTSTVVCIPVYIRNRMAYAIISYLYSSTAIFSTFDQ